MKTFSLLLALTIAVFNAGLAQSDIPDFPGSLKKELARINGKSDVKLTPMNHPENGKFYRVENTDGKQVIEYVYIGRVNTCRADGCSKASTINNESAPEYFEYFILYNSDISVRLVKVFNYQATHGHEITATGWLKQFIGYDGSYALTGNKSTDAISGATISVASISIDIEDKTKLLSRLIAERVKN